MYIIMYKIQFFTLNDFLCFHQKFFIIKKTFEHQNSYQQFLAIFHE